MTNPINEPHLDIVEGNDVSIGDAFTWENKQTVHVVLLLKSMEINEITTCVLNEFRPSIP